jgi:hypothetical protein
MRLWKMIPVFVVFTIDLIHGQGGDLGSRKSSVAATMSTRSLGGDENLADVAIDNANVALPNA